MIWDRYFCELSLSASVLEKLSAFHRDHQTEGPALLRDLQAAVDQVPAQEYPAEAVPLQDELTRINQ